MKTASFYGRGFLMRALRRRGERPGNRVSEKERKKPMYSKVAKDLNFVEREKQIGKFWKDHDIFQKSIENRKDGPVYTFYDGPPTANGKPHIGHVETRTIKDMIPRYRTMKGSRWKSCLA